MPAHQSEWEWTGKAVRELAASGSVYIRLLTERDESEDGAASDSSSSTSGSKEPDVKIVKVETAGIMLVLDIIFCV